MRLVSLTVSLAALALAAVAPAVAVTRRPPALPGFSVVAHARDGGTLMTGIFPSATAPRPLRPGFVYLPAGLDAAHRYPVVYLLHGMPGDPDEYVSSLAIQALADRLISSGAVAPFIAVMPAAGPDVHYNGEWAGPWETYVARDVVPWIDAHLPTDASAGGRTIAGLSAGGYGAADIGLRSPSLFGRIESWSGYFHPLHDGPLQGASPQLLTANDAFALAQREAPLLRARGTRFFLGSGPSHSHWFKEQQTLDFAALLRRLRLPLTLVLEPTSKGQYALQLEAGLRWALGAAAR